jgi:hypothetical protein
MRLLTALIHPRRTLCECEAQESWPLQVWVPLALLAIGGSILFGASMAPHMNWSFWGSAGWLTLGAGSGWLLLGPTLRGVTALPWRVLAHACLVTMAYGELVLLSGAAVFRGWPPAHPMGAHFLLIGLSNVVMGTALVVQLKALGIPRWRTALCWCGVLNGGGALSFYLLRTWLVR